jgi:ribonuclease HI
MSKPFRRKTPNGFYEPALTSSRFHIYTDGACEPNPGAGGWAFVVIESGIEINNRNGGDIQATNNIMELIAILRALEYAKASALPVADTVIYSDSQYCVRGCTEWRHGWQRKGWTRGKEALANAGLWKAIAAAHDAFPCKIIWVRGHSGVPGNERADRLADKGRAYAIEHRVTDVGVAA